VGWIHLAQDTDRWRAVVNLRVLAPRICFVNRSRRKHDWKGAFVVPHEYFKAVPHNQRGI
jgi:hypothetical protein